MINIYRHQFVCVCPANKQPIIYNLEIQSKKMIRVEHIVLACQMFQQEYHEKIADDIHGRFGGFHILKAHHHGVDIETQRGALDELAQ